MTTTQLIPYIGYLLAVLLIVLFWYWKRNMDKFIQTEIDRRLEEAKNDHSSPIFTFRGRFNDALELKDLCDQLLLFTEYNGFVNNGFRTLEIMNQIRTLIDRKDGNDE